MQIGGHVPMKSMLGNRLVNRRGLGLMLWAALVVFQLLYWLTGENLVAGLFTLGGGLLGVSTLLRRNLLLAYPISTSMLLGYTVSYFLLPPIATLSEWKPLTNNLDHPTLVFFHSFVCFLFLLGTHKIYRRIRILNGLRNFVSNRIYRPFGFFRAPSNMHLLLMGGFGMLAMSYQTFFVAVGAQELALGVTSKVIQGIYPLAYLPYCILVRPLLGDSIKLSPRWGWILTSYTAFLVVVSIGGNSRAAFLLGIVSFGMVYAYGTLIQLFSLRTKTIVLALTAIFLVEGFVVDLATSMVIVRGQRADISPVQLISETINTFWDKQEIAFRRIGDTTELAAWDERYLDNLFLARVSNLKFADNSIDLATKQSGAEQSRFRDLEWQRTLSVFPRPVIHGLGLPVDKDLTGTSSGGDLMLYTTTGDFEALRGSRTGSLFGSGFALFGWFYPLVLSVVAAFLFALADAQTTRKALPTSDPTRIAWTPTFNPLAIVTFFTWSFYLTSAATGVESMSGLSQFILRGWLQVFLLYISAYWIGYAILRIFRNRAM